MDQDIGPDGERALVHVVDRVRAGSAELDVGIAGKSLARRAHEADGSGVQDAGLPI